MIPVATGMPSSGPRYFTAKADATEAPRMLTILFPSRIVTSKREVEEVSSRTATPDGPLAPLTFGRSRIEEDDAHAVGVVPGLVVVGVVENQTSALLPVAHLLGDANAAGLHRFGHDKREMVAQHALEGAAMGGNALLRRQDREHPEIHHGFQLR